MFGARLECRRNIEGIRLNHRRNVERVTFDELAKLVNEYNRKVHEDSARMDMGTIMNCSREQIMHR